MSAWHIGDSLTVPQAAKHGIKCYSLPSVSDAAISLLAKGHWPKLLELHPDGGSISAAGIAQLHEAFVLIDSFSLHIIGLSSETIQALCPDT